MSPQPKAATEARFQRAKRARYHVLYVISAADERECGTPKALECGASAPLSQPDGLAYWDQCFLAYAGGSVRSSDASALVERERISSFLVHSDPSGHQMRRRTARTPRRFALRHQSILSARQIIAPASSSIFHLPPLRFAAALLLLLTASFAFGAEPSSPDRLAEALGALGEGVPQVAIVKLRQALATPLALTSADRKLAKAKLAEALLSAGQPGEALQQVHDPEVKEPALEARIDAASGKWSDALAIYETLSTTAAGPDTTLARAECLRQLGRLPEAVEALEKVAGGAPATVQLRLAELYVEQDQLEKCDKFLPSIKPRTPGEQKWEQYVEARSRLAEGHADYAFNRFKNLLEDAPQNDPQGLTQNILAGSALGWAEASFERSGLTAAEEPLNRFIWRYQTSPHLDLAFRKLDEFHSYEEAPSEVNFQMWTNEEWGAKAPVRAGFAQYYLAMDLEREGKPKAALGKLENFAGRYPNHPILPDALLLRGKLLSEQQHFAEARQALDDATRAARDDSMRAEIQMASASAYFQAGDYARAAAGFREVAQHTPALRETALFNSALSWLHQRNYSHFSEDCDELSRRYPESPLRCELILEEGLLQARQSEPLADSTLRQFVREFPDNPRASEARLALAELRFVANDAPGANRYLHAVNSATAQPETVEQSDYLAIFVADAAPEPDDDKVIALCLAFIDRYPATAESLGSASHEQQQQQQESHLPDVRMKLGQVYFRRGEFNNAQTQFEILARETPNSSQAEKALFLAGEASIKSQSPQGLDRAVELFGQVVKRDGPLKFYARLKLAEIQKPDDANHLYDDILRANPPSEVKFAALVGKGLNLSSMGVKDPSKYEEALKVYDQLATESQAAPDGNWHTQALYQKGRCLEALNRPNEALTAFYDVLGAGKPREYFWFYKAGFEAGHLCESQEQWKSAVGIYQKMSALEGPRAEEAKARVKQLRMAHFIWE